MAADAGRGGARILVAEDDPINQQVIAAHLRLLGQPFDMADDGQHALEKWQRGDYALILTDLMMPRLDGYGLLHALREAGAASGRAVPPVLVLTARGAAEEQAHADAAGAAELLRKPLPVARLREALARWLPAGAEAVADAAARPGTQPLFDIAVLDELLGHDRGAVAEMVADFAAAAQRQGDELQQALRGGDFAHAHALAHKLTSSAGAVGALALAEFCNRLQRPRARGGFGDGGEGALVAQDLQRLLVDTLAAMQQATTGPAA